MVYAIIVYRMFYIGVRCIVPKTFKNAAWGILGPSGAMRIRRIRRFLSSLDLSRLLYRIGVCVKIAPALQQQIRNRLHLEYALVLVRGIH
jgi:hypothetical protein